MNYDDVLDIKRCLPKTWKIFFGSFGKLLPVQVKTIPLILAGHNAIIASPTASGKTEAVVAPIVEKLLQEENQGLSVLYISPTRALVNDLHERLKDQIQELGISLAVKTGDRSQFIPQNPQEFLITTPESFDSLICRHPNVFSDTRFVVLDELHLLDGTYRGDHLRILLERLRVIKANEEPKYYALSATFRNPEGVASRYFYPFEIVSVKGQREIKFELVEAADLKKALGTTISRFRENGIHKALFFCNSRRETEELAQIIRKEDIWPKDRVFVHHGSISKAEREETEEMMRIGKGVLCVATMSLEVGIDIGDIDAIVLVRPPPSVSSLLQRIGRGNRRKGYAFAIGLYSTDEEMVVFQRLFKMAQNGVLEDITHGPCLSVAVQQIFSTLYQTRFTGVRKESLQLLLRRLTIGEDLTELVLSRLRDRGFIHLQASVYVPSTRLIDLAERGLIHSNIPDGQGYRVIESFSGREIGEISLLDPLEGNIAIGGRIWRILRIEGTKIYVSPAGKDAIMTPSFALTPTHGKFYSILPQAAKEHCCKTIL